MSKRHRLNLSWRAARIVAAGVCALGLIAVLWTVTGHFRQFASEASQEASQPDGREPSAQSPRPEASAGPAAVKLSAGQQKQIDLQTTAVAAAPHRDQLRAYGAVLDIARITELTNSYANASAQLQTAQAKLEVSKGAFERAKRLGQSAAMSAAQVEAAEGTLRVDQAALAAAESQLRTLAATAQQEWGPVIGKAIVDRAPAVVRLIERQQFLVQVTLPPGAAFADPPPTALAEAPTGQTNVELQYLSPATRMDSRIQGVSYFYSAPGDSGLLPGMNIIVHVPYGKTYEGVIVDGAAIVHWQGQPWVYLRVGPDTFRRNPISTDQPVSDDAYVARDIPSGSEIVIQGAQALLSEETKSEQQSSDDND